MKLLCAVVVSQLGVWMRDQRLLVDDVRNHAILLFKLLWRLWWVIVVWRELDGRGTELGNRYKDFKQSFTQTYF